MAAMRNRKLPWTGQTTCHDSAGRVVPCGGSGQDAEFWRGVPWPAPRFEVAGAEVLDHLTGIWTRDANPLVLPLTWTEALERTSEMNLEQPRLIVASTRPARAPQPRHRTYGLKGGGWRR